MTKSRIPREVLPVGAVMAVPEVPVEKVTRSLEEFFGQEPVLFDEFSVQDFTDYYNEEMGPDIRKWFYYVPALKEVEGSEQWKRRTIQLESEFAEKYDMNRPVNIDPGYLTLSKLILFSTKGFAHRIYIRDDIYAEVTLQFRHKEFHPVPWTFQDYQTEFAFEFWTKARKVLRGLLGNQV
ncbi:MAG: DUF4416 family protein [Candidatus Marinimicrobia bacterium]|nr:DUF4416 family protein [Candidatus Neomarinimicrobiota bacterium]MCF7829873.1 DUF4416 family protein [Candidatus Neomarinimicrobiota bacterium]MCF7879164.1 DUF4416 family protein [Candidatus Neomarinimicrobiota bacterium]